MVEKVRPIAKRALIETHGDFNTFKRVIEWYTIDNPREHVSFKWMLYILNSIDKNDDGQLTTLKQPNSISRINIPISPTVEKGLATYRMEYTEVEDDDG